MIAGCADSGSRWLHWSPLSRCSDSVHCSGSHVAFQTNRLDLPRSREWSEDLAGQAPKLKAAEAELVAAAEVEAGIVEVLAPEPLDAGNGNQGYHRVDHQAVVDDSRRVTLSDVTSIVDEEVQE